MKQDIKKRWVEALRSGEYEQGKHRLCIDNKYCCLGVLAEIAHQENLVNKKPDIDNPDMMCFEGDGAVLPIEVVKWSGLKRLDGDDLIYKGKSYSLPALNDGQALTFNEIADLIEAQL